MARGMEPFVGLDESMRGHLLELAAEELRTPQYLQREVTAYVSKLERIAPTHDYLDITLAKACARSLISLLDKVDHTDVDKLTAVQIAVRYFVLEDDDEGDVGSLLGFDDDVAVMNCVCDYLGLTDLQVALPD